ncbi:baseplate J/gp47 family protein [Chitinimonas naiadis]
MAQKHPRDLTRWNRAGLARVSYVDGNAALFLDRLRDRLHTTFPQWRATEPELGNGTVDLSAREQMEAVYARNPDDMLWQLTRAYARAGHVLAGSLDATANEGWIGTATQWESLRRLTAMLDYAPHPPASAFTSLALLYKPGLSGKVAAGFQVRYAPSNGGKPLIFETLEDLDGDASLNALRPLGHDRNPRALSGTRFTLAGKFDKVKSGEPLVLEDERGNAPHRLQAYRIVGVSHTETDTTLDLSPPVAANDGFLRGYTRFHILPKDKLSALAPRTTGAEVGTGLRLTAVPEGLVAGDIVAIGRPEGKPYFRRIKEIRAETLGFYKALGNLDLLNSTVMVPITIAIAHMGGNRRNLESDDTQVRVLYVAGDWGWLAGRWLADIRHAPNQQGQLQEYLPMYECIKANYFPPTSKGEGAELAGYTALTMTWRNNQDQGEGDPDLHLDNPQTLFTAPRTAGPWRPDTFLQKSSNGRLTEPLVVAQPKRTAPGDLAVLVCGGTLAWARLRHVSVDADNGSARLDSETGWQDRGGAPFFLTPSRVYAHFSETAYCLDASENRTALDSPIIPVAALPPALRAGRRVLIDNGSLCIATRISELSPAGGSSWIKLADPPPSGSTYGNFTLRGNVALAGHGESKPVKALGSGNAAINHQRFVLDVTDASFVADPSMPGGVRADLVVSIAGERWTQVGNLGDSRDTDAHYQVRQNEDGRLAIEFGDGRHGRRLPTGGNNVLVRYRQGVGSAGNLPADQLTKPVHPHALVEAVAQPMPASGGGEREGPEALRTNAAGALLALERAVSLSDFAALARGNAAVAQADAFALQPGKAQRERIELVVVPAGGGSFTTALRDNLQSYLLAHALPGVQLTVSAYQAVTFGLRVSVRVRPEAFDKEVVKQAVYAALRDAFSLSRRALGQAFYRGEVYAVVDAVAGVENSDVAIHLAIDHSDPNAIKRLSVDANNVVLAAQPWPRQCIHLPASNPDIVVTVEDFFL